MSLLDDLRVLAAHVSPSFRVTPNEAEGVLAALIQYAEHGPKILEEAAAGAQNVADFYHDAQVQAAQEAGVDEPVKGAPVSNNPQPPAQASQTVGPQPGAADVAALVQQVQALMAELAAAERPTQVEVGPAGVTPPAADEAESGRVEAPNETSAHNEAAVAPQEHAPAAADSLPAAAEPPATGSGFTFGSSGEHA